MLWSEKESTSAWSQKNYEIIVMSIICIKVLKYVSDQPPRQNIKMECISCWQLWKTYQVKPTSLPNINYQTNPTKESLAHRAFQTKPTKPNLPPQPKLPKYV